MNPGVIIAGDGKHHIIHRNGGTGDIIRAIVAADKLNAAYVADFARSIQGETLQDVCYNLWKFLKDNIPYQEDPDGFQFVQSPGELYKNRSIATGGTGKGGDCKSYSNFLSACLKNLGIPHFYRFISENKADDFHHVYVCVPTGTGNDYLVLDAVLSAFNQEVAWKKKKDIWGDMNIPARASIGAVRGAGLFGSQQEEYEKAAAWAREEEKMKDEFFRQKYIDDLKYRLERGLYFAWKNVNHIKYAEFRKRLINKTEGFAALVRMSSALVYHYWDDSKAPFIDPITRTKTVELEKKRDYVSKDIYTTLKDEVRFRESEIRNLCNLGTYFVHGITLDHMLDKCYNMVNYGQPWGPVNGVPYFDFNKKVFIRNGADAELAKRIELCLPYDGGITRLAGEPFWNHYGFIMRNGADDKKLADWAKKNPRPTSSPGIWKKSPTAADQKYFTEIAIPAYTAWLNGNTPGFPAPPANTPGNKKDRFSTNPFAQVTGVGSPKIGDGGISAVIGTVVAVISAVIAVAGFVIGIIKQFQKPNLGNIPNPPGDFKMEYQAVDGSYIGVAPAECGDLKAKYFPATGKVECLTAAQLAAANNEPMGAGTGGTNPQGFFNLGTPKTLMFAGGAALVAAGLLLNDNKN